MSDFNTKTLKNLWPRIFAAFDKTHNHRVTKGERMLIGKHAKGAGMLVQVMNMADEDGDGNIDEKEWDHMFTKMIKQFGAPDDETIESAFKAYESIIALNKHLDEMDDEEPVNLSPRSSQLKLGIRK